jgi:serine/threonine-protein kinase
MNAPNERKPLPHEEPTQIMDNGPGDNGPTRVMTPASGTHPSDATNVMPPGATPTSRSWPGASGDTASSTPGGTLPGSAQLDAGATQANEPQVRQVGRYEITERLGKGGMASVYRAHDPSIERDVAVKFLHATLAQDDEYRERFLREARAAGSLAHPNIVTVHDVGQIQGRPYMAMELLDGQTLSDLLDKDRMLPVRDAVLIGMQLARALGYAHARGIVHRDIKPGNIMLLRDGQTIKVTDFGIAHMDDGGRAQTQVGAVLGTPQYMSPEQTRGEKLDGRSDLFSAGIVLYQMLSGERPFRGDSLVAVATKIANEDPPSLTAKRREVPATLRRVVERCLAKSPAQRYQSGEELAEALKKVLLELEEAARERDKPRIVPLRVKWALMMSLVVAVVMGITAAVITQRQYAAMMDQVSDYGASLARFIAKMNAAAVLGEEWETVDVAVQEMMKTGNFERISVIDLGGVVRASSEHALVGHPYRSPAAEPLGTVGGATASRYQVGRNPVLGFEAPVKFLDREVGRVALGIPEEPLTRVARLSITLMVVLALVTVIAVAVAMYFVANWFARPIRLVCESMDELAKGRMDHRIHEQRRDEFGELYAAFDRMAEALQKREAGDAERLSTPAPSITLALASTPVPPTPPAPPTSPPPVA